MRVLKSLVTNRVVLGRLLPMLALFLFAALGNSAFAVDATLPESGVDVGSYAAALLTKLGVVIGAAIGAGFAIFAIWQGFRYVKSAIKGR